MERDILLFLRGDVGDGARQPQYSRSIRQAYAQLSRRGLPPGATTRDGDTWAWSEQHRILVGTGEDFPGSYSELLRRSVFCLVAPGAPR